MNVYSSVIRGSEKLETTQMSLTGEQIVKQTNSRTLEYYLAA